jgi:hypothetical protein
MPEAAKDAFAELCLAFETFEEIFQNAAPKGKRCVFSYRHGNNGVSVGLALTEGRKTSASIDWFPNA